MSANDVNGASVHLVLPLDTLGLALGRGAAVRAGVGGSRAAEGDGRRLDLGSSRSGGGFDQTFLVEVFEPSLVDVGVILEQLALDALLDGSLLFDLVDSVGKDGVLATAESVHTGRHGGETIEAHANGLAALLLGQDVVLLFLSIGEARAVAVRGGAVAAGRRGARVGVGRHGAWLRWLACDFGGL